MRALIAALLTNRWGTVGLGLVGVGWAPLLLILLLSTIGLWPDSDPNPVGPGMLFALTFWPAVICLAIGYAKSRRVK